MLLLNYLRGVLSNVTWSHWVVMGMLSLAMTIIVLIRKKYSAYGAVCLGITFFIGLFLLDAAVISRLSCAVHTENGFGLMAEYHRLIHGGLARWTEMLANVAVFIPFGFFLSEFLFATKRLVLRCRFGLIALFTINLSLCIEFFQLILSLGVCEVTDLVLNTLGGLIGASLALLVRRLASLQSHKGRSQTNIFTPKNEFYTK